MPWLASPQPEWPRNGCVGRLRARGRPVRMRTGLWAGAGWVPRGGALVPQAIEPFESIAIMPIVSYLISSPCGSAWHSPPHSCACAQRVAVRHMLQRSTCCNAAHVAARHILQRGTCCSAAHVATQHILQRGTCCNAARVAAQHSTASCGLPPADGRVLTPIQPMALPPRRYASPLCSDSGIHWHSVQSTAQLSAYPRGMPLAS